MGAEKERHNTSQILEKIFSSLFGMVAYLDREFNFIRVNKAYAEADGRPPEDFVGKNHFELYPHAENEAIFRRVIECDEPYIAYSKPFEYPDAPERGTSYWDWELTPVHDGQGKVDGLLLSLHEVTDRVEAEQARLKSEERFRLLFDSSVDAIFFLDSKGDFIEVNQMLCERLGYSREELLLMNASDLHDEESRHQVSQSLKRLATDGMVMVETRHTARDGRTIPIEISARWVDYEDAPVILCIARDISKRLASEEALRDSEANIRALFNATAESAMLLDQQGNIQVINETGAKRLRSTPEQMIGNRVFDFMPPEVAESRDKLLKKISRSGEPFYHQDVREGSHFTTTIYPVMNDRGETERLALFSKDVTEEHHLQATDILLRDIDSHVLHADSLEQLMDMTCRELVEQLDYSLAWIGRKEPGGRIEIVSLFEKGTGYGEAIREIGVHWEDTPLGTGPTGTAIRTGEVQLHKVSEQRFSPWREAAEKQGFAAAYSVPLTLKGEVYGALTLYSAQEETFDNPAELERIRSIANRLRIASDNSLNQQQLRLQGAALSAAGSGVMITDREGHIVWVNEALCRQSGYSERELVGMTPRILKSDIHQKAFYAELWATLLAGHRWAGETIERHRDGSPYSVSQTITPIHDNQGEISHFIAIHDDITKQKEALERVEYLAHYDTLTGMANRVLFYERLKHMIAMAKRDGSGFALLFLDLDKFKPINDNYGHLVGDALLKEVARRIVSVLRETDTGARLGGDEFTVILPSVVTGEEARLVAGKLSEVIAQPYEIEGNELEVVVSIGIALYPQHGESDAELITAADSAMYQAKQEGKGIAMAGED